MEELRELLSYNPPGYYFSPKFKNKTWDGRIYLIFKDQIFPTGLVSKVIEFFDEEDINYQVIDERLFPKGLPLSLPEPSSAGR